MRWQRVRRWGGYLGIMGAVSLLAAGCVIRDPQAIADIAQARKAIDSSKQAGAADRFPDEFADLEKRYLETRGTFYACQDDAASKMAMALAADATALASKRVAMPTPPPPPAPNRPPKVAIQVPAEVEVDQLVRFFSDGTTDPDGDKLKYLWSLGDGTTSSRPDTSHIYTTPGKYTVRLIAKDGRGGEGQAQRSISVVRHVVMQETKGNVLFAHDRAVLRPKAKEALAPIIQEMKKNPQLRTEIVGHTDSSGDADYNMRLSKKRAEAVRAYMVSRGIPAARLSISWKGESQPVVSNATKQGRAQNRRVEFTIRPAEEQ